MAHIPPGVDSYSTAKKWMALCTVASPQMFLPRRRCRRRWPATAMSSSWRSSRTPHGRGAIAGAGGKKDGGEGNAVKLVASISPVDGNTPSFTVARIDVANSDDPGLLGDCGVKRDRNRYDVDGEYDFARAIRRTSPPE